MLIVAILFILSMFYAVRQFVYQVRQKQLDSLFRIRKDLEGLLS